MNDAAAAILKLDLKGKIRWLIALRWLAAAGLAVVITERASCSPYLYRCCRFTRAICF